MMRVRQSYGEAAEKKYLQNKQHSILIELVRFYPKTFLLDRREEPLYVSTRGLHVFKFALLQRQCGSFDHFCYLCFVFAMFSCLLIAALWTPAGKGLNSWLSYM